MGVKIIFQKSRNVFVSYFWKYLIVNWFQFFLGKPFWCLAIMVFYVYSISQWRANRSGRRESTPHPIPSISHILVTALNICDFSVQSMDMQQWCMEGSLSNLPIFISLNILIQGCCLLWSIWHILRKYLNSIFLYGIIQSMADLVQNLRWTIQKYICLITTSVWYVSFKWNKIFKTFKIAALGLLEFICWICFTAQFIHFLSRKKNWSIAWVNAWNLLQLL